MSFGSKDSSGDHTPRLTDGLARLIRDVQAGPGGVLRMTPDQAALWELERLPAAPCSAHLGAVMRCRGGLNPEYLRHAFAELQRRQELLRSTVGLHQESPVFLVAPEMDLPWTAVDLSTAIPCDRERLERELIDGAFTRPFARRKSPLWRALWIKRREDEGLLVVVIHQLIADVASLEVIFAEISEHYAASAAGQPFWLPRIEIPYSALLASQTRRTSGVARAHLQAWWHGQLAGSPQAVFLPGFRRSGPSEPAMVPPVRFLEDAPLADGIRAFSLETGVSPSTVVFAGLIAVLHRYTSGKDFVVATEAVTGGVGGTQGVVGPFSSPLPLRIRWAEEPGFRELADITGAVMTQAYRHRDLSYQEVLRSGLGDPVPLPGLLPRILCRFEGRGWMLPEFEGVEVTVLERRRGPGPFHLVVDIRSGPSGLEGSVDFRPDAIDRETVRRFTQHLQTLLSGGLATPSASLGHLPLLPRRERELVTRDWSHTWVKVREEIGVHELIEEQSKAAPGGVAAVCKDDSLTYGELNALSNRLAHELRSEGVGKGTPVGVWLPRSIDQLVCLLGVLKAGGAVVSLHPGWALGEVRQALEQAGVSLLLTQPRLARILSSIPGSRAWPHVVFLRRTPLGVVALGADDGAIDWIPALHDVHRMPVTPVEPAHSPGSPAFVFFSRAPGALGGMHVVSHAAMANAVDWSIRQFQFTPEDRLLLSAPSTWGPSVQDLLSALASGAVVRLATEGEVVDGGRLLRLIDQEPVTIWASAPSYLARLVRGAVARKPSAPSRLRLFLLGGEPLPSQLIEGLRSQFPAAGVVELGTSAHLPLWLNASRVGESAASYPAAVSPTRLLQNTEFLVLDPEGQPCPIGVPGRLAVRGTGLPWPTQPAASAEPDSGLVPGGGGCLTGDLARWCPDGTLELLGRADARVQRGSLMVDIDMLEAVFGAHPGVDECAVVTCPDEGGGVRLVAYVVPKSVADPAEWRQYLAIHLPAWMLPDEFHPVSELPLDLEGRIDRVALGEAAQSGILPASEEPRRKAA